MSPKLCGFSYKDNYLIERLGCGPDNAGCHCGTGKRLLVSPKCPDSCGTQPALCARGSSGGVKWVGHAVDLSRLRMCGTVLQ